MTLDHRIVEHEVLDRLERRLAEDGYTVIRQPGVNDLPPFLRGARPDAIAVGRDPKLLIEVVNQRNREKVRAGRIAQLQSLLQGELGWQLHVVYVKAEVRQPTPASAGEIRQRLIKVRELSGVDLQAGLVMGWSLLEASTRLVIPHDAARALTPATTVELLTSQGYITQSEADVLREAGRQRNLTVHGDVSVAVTIATVDAVLGAVDAVLSGGSATEPASE